MTKHKIGIIVPTIREKSLEQFLNVWKQEFISASEKYNIFLYIIEDNKKPTFRINRKNTPYLVYHLAWSDISEKLGERAWIFPRRSAAVRSFGFYLAFLNGCEYFITLDDDCYPSY